MVQRLPDTAGEGSAEEVAAGLAASAAGFGDAARDCMPLPPSPPPPPPSSGSTRDGGDRTAAASEPAPRWFNALSCESAASSAAAESPAMITLTAPSSPCSGVLPPPVALSERIPGLNDCRCLLSRITRSLTGQSAFQAQ